MHFKSSQETNCSLWCPPLILTSRWSSVFAFTLQSRKDAFCDHSCPDHVSPGETTARSKHGDVKHKLLMEEAPLIRELEPWGVTTQPLHTSISLHTHWYTQPSLMHSCISIDFMLIMEFNFHQLLVFGVWFTHYTHIVSADKSAALQQLVVAF